MKLEALFEGSRSLGALHHRSYSDSAPNLRKGKIMKLEQLNEQIDSKFGKEITDGIRQDAAAYEFVIDTGSSGVRLNKAEAVIAFTLIEAGGKKGQQAILSGDRLPQDIRVRGFLKRAADRLGAYMDQGRKVQILDRGVGSRIDVTNKADLLTLLKKHVSAPDGKLSYFGKHGPTIGWAVGDSPEGLADVPKRQLRARLIVSALTGKQVKRYGKPAPEYDYRQSDFVMNMEEKDPRFKELKKTLSDYTLPFIDDENHLESVVKEMSKLSQKFGGKELWNGKSELQSADFSLKITPQSPQDVITLERDDFEKFIAQLKVLKQKYV